MWEKLLPEGCPDQTLEDTHRREALCVPTMRGLLLPEPTSEPTLENTHMPGRSTASVRNVGRPAIFPACTDIRDCIWGRSPADVKTAARASNSLPTSLSTRASTLGRSLTDVLSVGKASVRVQCSLNTRELTLEKNPTNVWTVEKALDSTHFLGHPRLHQDKLPSHRCASA
jgi:hypothetical protein